MPETQAEAQFQHDSTRNRDVVELWSTLRRKERKGAGYLRRRKKKAYSWNRLALKPAAIPVIPVIPTISDYHQLSRAPGSISRSRDPIMLGTRSDEAGTTASSQSEHFRRLPVSNHPENMSEKALLDENSILGDSRKEALTHSHDVLNVQGCDSEKAARSGGSSVNEYRSSQLDSVDQGDANGPYQEGQHIRGREESATFQLEKMRHRPRSEGRTLLAPSEPASKPVSKINSKKTLAAIVEYRSDRIGILQAPTSHVHRPDHDTQLTSQTQRAQQIDDSNPQVTDALEREAQKQEPQTLHGNAPDFVSASFPSHASKQPEAAGQVAQKRKRVFSHRSKTGCMTCRRRKKKCDEQHPACKSSYLSFVLTAIPEWQCTNACSRQQLHSWRLSMRGIHVAKYMPEALQPKNVGTFAITRSQPRQQWPAFIRKLPSL